MKILEKVEFKPYEWIDFKGLPYSDGYRVTINYRCSEEDDVTVSIKVFHLLFDEFIDSLVVGQLGEEIGWGDYTLDTWNIHTGEIDYSPENKEEPTASYLLMLEASGIEPEYTGHCKCLDWDKFLYYTIYCVMTHVASYGMLHYIPKHEIFFYIHHTCGIGFYYKEMNDAVKSILTKAENKGLEVIRFPRE